MIRRIGKIDTPFYPEEVTAKYMILAIDLVGVCKGDHEKAAFIRHIVENHLLTVESVDEFKKRVMNEHVWINSHLSRLVGAYAIAILGEGSLGARVIGRTVIKRVFLQMVVWEVLGFRFVYNSLVKFNENFNSIIELESVPRKWTRNLIVIRKKTKPEYRARLIRDLGEDLLDEALEMDDQLTKGMLEATPRMAGIHKEFAEIVAEPFCELNGDPYCEYHIRINGPQRSGFSILKGLVSTVFLRIAFALPLFKKMSNTLISMEIEIQRQTRMLTDSQIRLEERVSRRTRDLRTLNAHLILMEEKQRKEMADQLHEGLGQELALSRMITAMLLSRPENSHAVEDLKKLNAYIQSAIAKTRAMTNDLSPPVLHELGLFDALIWLAEKIESENAVSVELDMWPSDVPVSKDNSILMFRVAQELFFNIIKHSRATHVTLGYTQSDDLVTVSIHDNGIGFEPSEVTAFNDPGETGYGLYSIKDRVKFAGGRFSLESSPGKGCKATIHLPCA
ncbi:MAG: sensor histidine kinase [Desulfobacterales bacterium]|nr:sensor histidine kinase [Desulfobacterales bacterium]